MLEDYQPSIASQNLHLLIEIKMEIPKSNVLIITPKMALKFAPDQVGRNQK
jgi:hypothetical protein